jgi:hypothetical protein
VEAEEDDEDEEEEDDEEEDKVGVECDDFIALAAGGRAPCVGGFRAERRRATAAW